MSLSIEVDNIKTSRAYSIASSPSDTGYFDLTLRRMEEGLVSNYLLDNGIERIDNSDCLQIREMQPLQN